MISIKNLCFDYPGTHALKNINCEIPEGSITALVGPNGSGKTTLLRSISALGTPLSGSIEINGWRTSDDPRKIHEICSYLSDFFGLYDTLSVEQCLKYSAWSHNCDSGEISNLVSTVTNELSLKEHLHKDAGSLSRGLRQRLAIAQTIIHKPKYILLDEPASGLDPDARINLSQLLIKLKEQGITLVVSSHILAELEDYCTHMMVLRKGELVEFTEVGSNTKNNKQKIIEIVLTKNSKATDYEVQLLEIGNINIESSEKNVFLITINNDSITNKELLQKCISMNIPIESFKEKDKNLQSHYLDLTKSSQKEPK
jgi:ABC-2 type transport system ATP-binding protein